MEPCDGAVLRMANPPVVNPSPVPRVMSFVLTNGSKSRLRMAGSIPGLMFETSRWMPDLNPCAAEVADPGRGLAGLEAGRGRREQSDGSSLICPSP